MLREAIAYNIYSQLTNAMARIKDNDSDFDNELSNHDKTQMLEEIKFHLDRLGLDKVGHENSHRVEIIVNKYNIDTLSSKLAVFLYYLKKMPSKPKE